MDFKTALKDTLSIRRYMLQSLADLHNKELTPREARARAALIRTALDTIRIEIVASREGLRGYAPVNMVDDMTIKTIDHDS